MNKLRKELYTWAEKYHKEHRDFPDKGKIRDMYSKMPYRLKFMFLCHYIRCFYNHRIFSKFPLSWRIKRLERFLAREEARVRKNFIHNRFEILDL